MVKTNNHVGQLGTASNHHQTVIDFEKDGADEKLLKNGNLSRNGLKNGEKSEYDRTMTEDINKLLREMPLTEDMTCGFWIFKGKFLQR